jgi:tripartite-type tricarboxylate transporter receptor subunit TctC
MSEKLTIVVSFPPGGATAFIAGVLASALTGSIGRQVEVETHTGEFGTRAIRQLLERPAGEVLMVGSVNTNSLAPVLHREELAFDYSESVIPVCRLADYAGVLAAQKESPDLPLAEFMAHLKGSKGRIVYGTDFLGTNVDIDILKLSEACGVEIAYRVATGALAILDDLEHHKIDMTVLNVGTMRRELGRYRPLAAISPTTRIDYLPDTPTMAEAGFSGIGVTHWLGVFVSRAISDNALSRLHGLIADSMSDSNVREQIEQTGAKVAVSASPLQFANEVEAEMAEWEALKPKILAIEEVK